MTRQVESIEMELDGEHHRCFYAVQSNMLTVWHEYLGSRTAAVRGPPTLEHVEALTRDVLQLRRARRSVCVDPLR